MGAQFVKKKVDSRVRALIEQGVRDSHRSFICVVGDHGKDQVMFLHYMLSKSRMTKKPSVLWCYKKDLGFSRLVALSYILLSTEYYYWYILA
jgi:N-acetyltransferase 10